MEELRDTYDIFEVSSDFPEFIAFDLIETVACSVYQSADPTKTTERGSGSARFACEWHLSINALMSLLTVATAFLQGVYHYRQKDAAVRAG
jgi:hypothetical protein